MPGLVLLGIVSIGCLAKDPFSFAIGATLLLAAGIALSVTMRFS